MEKMTRKEWNKIHRDFKGIYEGFHYVMRCVNGITKMVCVEVM